MDAEQLERIKNPQVGDRYEKGSGDGLIVCEVLVVGPVTVNGEVEGQSVNCQITFPNGEKKLLVSDPQSFAEMAVNTVLRGAIFKPAQ